MLAELLAEGRLDEVSVRAELSRLLPASDAPGVVDLREELHARVRGAVLSSGSVDALRDWVAGPGRDDAGAWRALAVTPGAPPAARSTAAFMRRVLGNRLGA